MKILKYIFILLLFSCSVKAQLTMNAGVVDVSDRMDGSSLAWGVGYTQILGKLGITGNYRYTAMLGDNYASAELMLRYRIQQKGYRLELAAGGGHNFDDHDLYPLAQLRNAFKIEQGTYITIDIDRAFRRKGETYLMVGISLDIKKEWQRLLNKPRFF